MPLLASVLCASNALGNPQDVQAALKAWADIYAANDGDKSAALYAPDARLWGTTAEKQTIGQSEVRDYFRARPDVLKSRVVEYGEHSCRNYDQVGVCSGHYEFSLTLAQGSVRKIPARFSMVFVKQDGRWLIVDHHSSVLPAQR
jgi:uncharacterized protein (TIGR02246 family)